MNQHKLPPEGLLKYLRDNGYKDLKVLENGTVVGTCDLMFTRGLCVGLDWLSWESRYCYEDRELASRAAAAYVDDDELPLPGYIATRGIDILQRKRLEGKL